MFWFVGATFLSVVPSIGKELLNANEQAVTFLTAAFTIGIGLGSLSCERLSNGKIELGLVPFAALAISAAAVDIWLAGPPVASESQLTISSFFAYGPATRLFFDLVIIGAAGALYIVPLYACLQARVAQAICSRMLATLNICNALLMVASAIFTLALFSAGVSLTGVFGIVAVLNLLAMAAGMFALPEFQQRALTIIARN